MSKGARNVLVVGPSSGTDVDDLCGRLLTDHGDVDTILGVTVVQTPAERLRAWRGHHSLGDVDSAFVDVGTAAKQAATDPDRPWEIDRVLDPSDLAMIGRSVTDRLEASEGDTSLCVHSLTALLEYVEPERLLEFMHKITNEVRSADATAHYHLERGAHEQETVDLFATVTDRVIELDATDPVA